MLDPQLTHSLARSLKHVLSVCPARKGVGGKLADDQSPIPLAELVFPRGRDKMSM